MWLHRLQTFPDMTLNPMERLETMPHIFHYVSNEEIRTSSNFESEQKKDRVTSRAAVVPTQLKRGELLPELRRFKMKLASISSKDLMLKNNQIP